MRTCGLSLVISLGLVAVGPAAYGEELQPLWPDLAPGETTRHRGDQLPFRSGEHPPVVRVVNITEPTFTVHLPDQPDGRAVVILPGGGFGKVVPNKEGSEAATWLNQQGIAAFVLRYRTAETPELGWPKALQDAQRMMSLVRCRAGDWNLDPDRIGLLGFSAGGQAAARLLCARERSYAAVDSIDRVSCQPDVSLLIYPWRLYDESAEELHDVYQVPQNCPPVFLVHTHDDRASSLGAVLFYAQLKQLNRPSELHVFASGGHGYGLRPVPGTNIASWPELAAAWLNSHLPESH